MCVCERERERERRVGEVPCVCVSTRERVRNDLRSSLIGGEGGGGADRWTEG